MAIDYDFLSIKSIKQFEKQTNAVLAMANHVKRGLQDVLGAKPHIVESKTSLNYSLHGLDEPQKILNHVNGTIAHAGITPQKNNVILISVVFSLPVSWHDKDSKDYFQDCYEWTIKAFGCEVITFDVHLDETNPHAHALLLPIITDSKTGDKKLGGSYVMGDRVKITSYRNDFFNQVASKYGFKQSQSKLSAKDKEQLADKLLSYASKTNDPMFKSAFFQTIRNLIYQYPEKFAGEVDFAIQKPEVQKRARNFVDIKRSKGKGAFVR